MKKTKNLTIKNVSKKALSLFLVLAMILGLFTGISVYASAETINHGEIYLDEWTNLYSDSYDDEHVFIFRPEKNGQYKFSIEDELGTPHAYLLENGYEMDFDYEEGSWACYITANLTSVNEYRLVISNFGSGGIRVYRQSGSGNSVTYTFDESTGLLTISGNGTMDDYDMNSPFEKLGIESVLIHSGVTSIGEFAFAFCETLTSISIPASVTSIGSYAFEGSYELTDVYYEGTEAEWNEIDIDDSNESLLAANIHFEEYPNPDSDPDPEPEYEYIEHGFLPVNSDSVSVNLAEYEIHQFFIENPGEYEITISGENECDASLFYIKGNGSEYIDRRYGNDITLIFSAKEDMFDVGVWLALEGEGNVEVTCRTIKAPTSIKYTPVQEYVLLQEAGGIIQHLMMMNKEILIVLILPIIIIQKIIHQAALQVATN